jgi:hypothetical protein
MNFANAHAALDNLAIYWRAENFVPAVQIFLWDNPLLKRPPSLSDLKPCCSGTGAQRPPEFHACLTGDPGLDTRRRRIRLFANIE